MCNPAACAKRCTCLEEHEKHLDDICPPDDKELNNEPSLTRSPKDDHFA